MSATTSFSNGDMFSCKISLKHCKSPVWRRVLVPINYTFKDLHDVIMAVMEWDDHHLHMFSFKHPLYGRIEIYEPCDDEREDNICYLPDCTPVAPFVQRSKQKISYEYDFGCSWEHVIEFEKKVDASCDVKYPKCLKGKGMPPPEDDPDSERSEAFDLRRMDSNLSRCKQFVKVLKQNAVKSVSEKHNSTPPANQSTVLKEQNEPPAKKRAIDTDHPSTSSAIPVETNLLNTKAVNSNDEKNNSTATKDNLKVGPLQGSPTKNLVSAPSGVLPFTSTPKKRAIDTDHPSASSTILVETNLQNAKAVNSNTEKNNITASDGSVKVAPLQGSPASGLDDCSPSIVLPPTFPPADFSTIPSVYAHVKKPPRPVEVTWCSRCEEREENMDYDDFYGRCVAINLKLVPDREMRANLRYDIQLAINKYKKFQKRT